MTILAIVLLAVVAMAPLAFALVRVRTTRGRRDSALRIQRAQLAELDRDMAEGRIAPAEYATAKLEVQRRLLATAETADPVARPGSSLPLLATLLLVPALAAGLYMIDGQPWMPAVPLAQRVAAEAVAAKDNAQSEALIAKLRDRLTTMDQTSDLARQGYLLLGNAEDSIGHLQLAAEAWHKALTIRFDPGLAALTAEARTQLEGRVSEESAALFRRALKEGAPDAPWRDLAQQRLDAAAKQ